MDPKTDLVGDNVELLLILALDVDGAVSAGEVDDAGSLKQRGDLLAGQRYA